MSSLATLVKTHLARMTEDEQREAFDILRQLQGPWVPQPGPQTQAYESMADETFYGGAAGGGKTDLLLGVAATLHTRTIIFRREGPQFRAMIERSHELYDSLGTFNQTEHMWRLKDGRTIEFGSVVNDDDWRKHQGQPHDNVSFDEVTQFLKLQYQVLRAWLRTTKPGQRLRTYATFNPPTSSDGQWVIEMLAPWLDPQHPNLAKPGELRWFAMVGKTEVECESGEPFTHHGHLIRPWSRTFVPSRVEDNAYLMANTDYINVLDSLPEPLRSQMRRGDMLAGTTDDPYQIIPTAWVKDAQQRWTDRPNANLALSCVGVDVARGGDDKTVLARRYGTYFGELEKHAGSETPTGYEAAELVLGALSAGGSANIDLIGWGASCYDIVRASTARVRGINNSSKAPAGARDASGQLAFVNMRAYGYWKLREALDPQDGEHLALPPDSDLLADLTAPRWKLMPSGIQVESKDDIKKRLGRSPDCADAVVLSFAYPPIITQEKRVIKKPGYLTAGSRR